MFDNGWFDARPATLPAVLVYSPYTAPTDRNTHTTPVVSYTRIAQTTLKQTAATADATAAPVTPPPTLAAPPTNPVLLLEGGGVPPTSPIARAPDDGARVCPGGSGIVGPAAAGAVEADAVAGAADPKMMPREEGIGASVGPVVIGLVEEEATGAADPATTNPPGGIVKVGVTGAAGTSAGIREGDATRSLEADGEGAVVPGKGFGGETRKAQKRYDTIERCVLDIDQRRQ